MWLLALCIALWLLFAQNIQLDRFSWLMVVAAGWFCGFMDARFFARSDQHDACQLPDKENDGPNNDKALFEADS
jgi:hypothetical protein